MHRLSQGRDRDRTREEIRGIEKGAGGTVVERRNQKTTNIFFALFASIYKASGNSRMSSSCPEAAKRKPNP